MPPSPADLTCLANGPKYHRVQEQHVKNRAVYQEGEATTGVSHLPVCVPIHSYAPDPFHGEPRILIVGGAGRNSKCELYYPTSTRPSTIFDLQRPRLHHTAASHSGGALISGGYAHDQEDGQAGPPRLASTAFIHGTSGFEAPTLPQPTSCHGSASIDQAIFVLGGTDTSYDVVSSCIVLKDQDLTWTEIRPMSTGRHHFATIASPSDEIFTVGGGGDSSPVPTAEAYNARTDQWRRTTPLPVSLSRLAGAYSTGRVYVCGGMTSSCPSRGDFHGVASVYSLDPRVGEWEEERPMLTDRSAHCVVPLNGKIYALGGADSSPARLSTVEYYEPRNKTWTPAKDLQLDATCSSATLHFS